MEKRPTPTLTGLPEQAKQELRQALIEDFGKYGAQYPEEYLEPLGDLLLAIHYLRP